LFSPGIPVSSTKKTDRHDTPEILFNVALNTINNPNHNLGNATQENKRLSNTTPVKSGGGLKVLWKSKQFSVVVKTFPLFSNASLIPGQFLDRGFSLTRKLLNQGF
jgi:hypothetical protein